VDFKRNDFWNWRITSWIIGKEGGRRMIIKTKLLISILLLSLFIIIPLVSTDLPTDISRPSTYTDNGNIATNEANAYDALGQIKTALKTIDTERKKITGPLNQSLKAANKMFKLLSEPFKTADSIIRGKILDFRREQEERAEKERERREKIQASHEAKGHQTYDLEEVAPEVAQQTVTTKRWTFEIIDESRIIRDYLKVDETKIRQAIRDGARDIAGLRIYQEEGLRV